MRRKILIFITSILLLNTNIKMGKKMGEFKLISKSFEANSEIPVKFTCQGKNISPELHWVNAPATTKSFVLIVDDPDAPDPANPKRTWVHWVVYNIPSFVNELPEGVKKLPEGAISGINDWGRGGYGGPCPPIGRHRYFFKLYSLNSILPILKNPTKQNVFKAMDGKVIKEAVLVGFYKKK